LYRDNYSFEINYKSTITQLIAKYGSLGDCWGVYNVYCALSIIFGENTCFCGETNTITHKYTIRVYIIHYRKYPVYGAKWYRRLNGLIVLKLKKKVYLCFFKNNSQLDPCIRKNFKCFSTMFTDRMYYNVLIFTPY